MRSFLFVVVLVAEVSAGACFSQQAEGQKTPTPVAPQQPAGAKRQPVLVELFTSEGCSSCPPADRNLKFLDEQQPVAGVDIVPLAFHVDYWDTREWKDQFSSALFTRRQEAYVQQFRLDSSYTPEMVVDGKAEFVGSDTGRSVKVIGDALRDQKGNIAASFDGDMINVTVDGLPKHEAATVFLAITDTGVISSVNGGENSGVTLNHSAIVRSLTALGVVDKDAAKFEARSRIPAVADEKAATRNLVLFVQDNNDRRILAVARLAAHPANTSAGN